MSDRLSCSACAQPMERLMLDAVMRGTCAIDVCWTCHAMWFDPYENLQLTPESTIHLFRMFADHSGSSSSGGFPPKLKCPRCTAGLTRASDMMRTTRFEYFRCGAGHGRFTRFVDFMKEKEFVKALTPAQVAELRKNVRTVHCSNCAAVIDLAKSSSCSYCGAPLSLLDMKKMAETARQIEGSATHAQPALPKDLQDREKQVTALFELQKQRYREQQEPLTVQSLVTWGLDAIADWLRAFPR